MLLLAKSRCYASNLTARARAMGFPWFRLVMFIVMLKGDNVEQAVLNIAHVVLSWSLGELFEVVRAFIMVPKLIALGKVHPEAWRKATLPVAYLSFQCALTAAIFYGLHAADSARLGWFLLLTVGALPVAKCAVFPRAWPVGVFMLALLYGVWAFEGVQELFVGLLLFQGVPVAQDLAKRALGGRRKRSALAAFIIWLCAFALVLPIPTIWCVAYFFPGVLEHFIRRRKREMFRGIWAKFEWYSRVLGYTDGAGKNPYRVLGLTQTASQAQIRKRFRDLSMMYHPDKTGNDPVKKETFIRIQQAMELITKGMYDDARPDDANAVMKRVSATVHRCATLASIIAMWFALSLLQGFAFMINRKQAPLETADDGAFPDVGPSFVGSGIFGMGTARHAHRRGAVDTRTVAGRRVTTPAGPMPTLVPAHERVTEEERADEDAEIVRDDAADASAIPPTIDAAQLRRRAHARAA